VVEKITIGRIQRIEIVLFHILFEGSAPPANPLKKNRSPGLKINDQVGFQDTLFENGGQLVVQAQFIITQIQIGENPILGE